MAAVLVLVAVGALVTGRLLESTELTWAAFAASVLAVVALGVGELRRRRAGGADRARSTAGVTGTASGPTRRPAAAPPRSVPDEDLPVRRVSPPPVPPSSPDVYGRGRRPQAQDPGDLAGHRPHGSWVDTGSVDRRAPTGSSRAVTGDVPGEPVAAPQVAASLGRTPAVASRQAADREPPAEDVEMTDLLLVLDLTDGVMVVDEHPRYHLERCPHLLGHQASSLPIDQARAAGFTPCSTCGPIRFFAARERARRPV